MDLRKNLSFGFEQTFTIPDWWTEEGFTSTSDTPIKREKMHDLAKELAGELKGKFFESKDIWDHMQYEVTDSAGVTQFYVTMDPGSIEVKTPPCLLEDVETMAIPLFAAAEKANVVAYRNWWYGVKAGTEGGCHVNMGGFTQDTNPLYAEPELVVKYSAYVHNRPFLHFPFMGLDVGPEGNAMRMDEKDGFTEVKNRFEDYTELYLSGGNLSPKETYEFFEQTNLITEKASYPSLYKFKEGLYLIEDRGQESLRNPEDFYLVSELRMQILEFLQGHDCENLKKFPNLHNNELTSFFLWDAFNKWAKEFSLPTDKYKRFFQRQFPLLNGGENQPENFFIHDGRRPRVITDIQKRGDVVISKTIDTTHKRFEIFTHDLEASFQIEGIGFEKLSQEITIEETKYHYLDIKYDPDQPQLKISLLKNEEVIETGIFNIHNMMWE